MSLTRLQLGHFRLKRRIGKSASEVYLAEDLRLGREVALKVAQIDTASFRTTRDRQKAVDKFKEEAKILCRFQHKHILPLYDYGQEIVGTIIYTYLVMPYKEGSLEQWIITHTGSFKTLLSLQDISNIVKMASEALQYAHNKNIIHRDVKPSNFLVEYEDGHLHILLSDFGIAKIANAGPTISTDGALLVGPGTPQYMAPEQWARKPTKESDQYALAVIAYQLLTGKLPFESNDYIELAIQHKLEPPPRPTSLNPSLPPTIDDILLRALAKQPTDRYPSIKQFADALQAATLQQPVRVLDQAGVRNPPPSSTPSPKPPPPPLFPPKNLLLAILALFIILTGATSFYFIWFPHGSINPAQATATATHNDNQPATTTPNVLQTSLATTPNVTDPLTSYTQNTPVAGWQGSNGSDSNCQFDFNGYHVSADGKYQQECSNMRYYNPHNNFTITVDMAMESNDSSGGLAFDVQPNGTGYFFEVSPNQQEYKFSILNCNINCDLLGWSKPLPDKIHNGHNTNNLEVIAKDNVFSLWFNGFHLIDYIDNNKNFSNGYLSLVCHDTKKQGRIEFSNLYIRP